MFDIGHIDLNVCRLAKFVDHQSGDISAGIGVARIATDGNRPGFHYNRAVGQLRKSFQTRQDTHGPFAGQIAGDTGAHGNIFFPKSGGGIVFSDQIGDFIRHTTAQLDRALWTAGGDELGRTFRGLIRCFWQFGCHRKCRWKRVLQGSDCCIEKAL